ncbi:MAG: TetR/AcrR family transcriptional regulator [Candidatus Limnocylindrales bacterium]
MSIERAANRPYHSPRRTEQANATRSAILDAARAAFVQNGYVATSIAGIARRAVVSAETIYATFGTKRAVLSALVDISIAGDDAPVAILDRGWVQALRAEPDHRRRVEILAHNGRLILERRAPIDEVVQGAAAADAKIRSLLEAGRAQRYAGQRALLGIVAGPRGFGHGLTLDAAADLLFTLGSPEVYQLLTGARGWSGDRFEAWYTESIASLLA